MGQGPLLPAVKNFHKKSKVIYELKKSTNMTVPELDGWYEKFMQHHPDGQVTLEDFIRTYEAHAPDCPEACRDFAKRIFEACDADGNGHIDVKEFITLINVTTKGTVEQKLHWLFDLYDADGNGYITQEEATGFIGSVYEMEGSQDPAGEAVTITKELFSKLDLNGDNVLSREEFISGARSMKIFRKLMPTS